MEEKNKKNAFITGGCTILYTSLQGLQALIESEKENEKNNLTGEDDISTIINISVGPNDFAVLHVKNDNFLSKSLLCEKIEKCAKKDISISLVLDTTAGTLGEMYKEIDLIQAYILKYSNKEKTSLDMPIYLNIDKIIENKDLNNVQKVALINAFLNKTSRSDMYVGLYGKDSNLVECQQLGIDTDSYDVFLRQESEEIKYQGPYNIKEDLNGEITSKYDLSKTIKELGLNQGEKVVNSAVYTAEEGDTYHSVAVKYELSEKDVRIYNNKPYGNLCEGEEIYIPNEYESYNRKTNQTIYSHAIGRGIDISNFQTNIDWERVSETSDFVIVQIARDGAKYEDPKSSHYLESGAKQITNAVANDISVGIYLCVQSGMNKKMYEGRLDDYFSKLVKDLANNNVNLDRENTPVFLDFEVFNDINDYYGLMQIFTKKCNEYGFKKIGIYGNKTTLDAIANQMKTNEKVILGNIVDSVWLSGGPQYKNEKKFKGTINLEDIQEPKSESNKDYTASIGQASNVVLGIDNDKDEINSGVGAANDANRCDVDFVYGDNIFSSETTEMTSKTFTYPTITNLQIGKISNGIIGAGLAIGCVFVALKVKADQKVKKMIKNTVYNKD